MKEKFRYRNIWGDILMYLWIIAFFVVLGICIALKDNIAASVTVLIVFPAAWLGGAALLQKMPAKLNADENSVEFVFLTKRVCILYREIKSVKVTHEYIEPEFRGEHGHYNEIINIVCEDGEYTFENIMDISLSETAKDPENLSKQFERGLFSRLKNYISKRTGITY